MKNTAKGSLVRRCPRLGNTVPFDYCEVCGDEQQPCFKILDCWWEHFDVVQYLKDNLTEESIQSSDGGPSQTKGHQPDRIDRTGQKTQQIKIVHR